MEKRFIYICPTLALLACVLLVETLPRSIGVPLSMGILGVSLLATFALPVVAAVAHAKR